MNKKLKIIFVKFKLKLFLIILLLNTFSYAQNKSLSVGLTNSHLSLPVIGYPSLFYASFQPGIDFQGYSKLNKKEKNEFYLKFQSGLIYQKFVQTLVYGFAGIQYKFNASKKFSIESSLAFGAGASFEGGGVSALQANGEYKTQSKFLPRAQYLINLNNGVSYLLKYESINQLRIFMQFQTIMQGTFVKGYVPLLPINSIVAGVRFNIAKKEIQ